MGSNIVLLGYSSYHIFACLPKPLDDPQKYVRTNHKVYFVSKSLSKCYFWFVLYFGSYRYIIYFKKKCFGDFISSFCYAAKQSNPIESQNIKELKNLYSRTLKLENPNPNSGSEKEIPTFVLFDSTRKIKSLSTFGPKG